MAAARLRGEHRAGAATAARPAPGAESRAAHRRNRGFRPARPDLPTGTRRPGPSPRSRRADRAAQGPARPGGARRGRAALVVPGRPGLASSRCPATPRPPAGRSPSPCAATRTASTSAGRSSAATAPTAPRPGLGRRPGDGTLRVFRGAKLGLADVGPQLVEEAMRPGHRLLAQVRLTDARETRSAPDPSARHHLVGRAGASSGTGRAAGAGALGRGTVQPAAATGAERTDQAW